MPIINMPTGIDTSDATATAASIRSGYTAYVNSEKLTGTLPTYSGATYVYPSTSTQTLGTSGCYMNGNITIYPQSSAYRYTSGSIYLSNANGNLSYTTVYVGFHAAFISGWRRSAAGNWYGWIVTPETNTITMDNQSNTRHTNGSVSRSNPYVTFYFRDANNNLFSSGTDIYWYAAGY